MSSASGHSTLTRPSRLAVEIAIVACAAAVASGGEWIRHCGCDPRGRTPRSLRPSTQPVLALLTVGDVYASLCKKGAYAPFSAKRRSRMLF